MVYEKKEAYLGTVSGFVPRNAEGYVLGVLRITMGWIWLWAFLDKLLGLGFATTAENAWINGKSPISGFLAFGTNPDSPFATFFTENLLQYADIMDFVLMGMFLFVGVSLTLGIFVRLASIAGIFFMISIVLAGIPFANNPIIDNHIVYAMILLFFITTPIVGQYIGIGSKWQELTIVNKYPILK